MTLAPESFNEQPMRATHPKISVFDSVLAGRLGPIASFSHFAPLLDINNAYKHPLIPNVMQEAGLGPRDLRPEMSESDKLADLVRVARLGRFTVMQNGLQRGRDQEPGIARLFLIAPVGTAGLSTSAETLRAVCTEVAAKPNIELRIVTWGMVNNSRMSGATRYSSLVHVSDPEASIAFYDDAQHAAMPGSAEYKDSADWHTWLASPEGARDPHYSLDYVWKLANVGDPQPDLLRPW